MPTPGRQQKISREPCIYCGSTEPRTSREHVIPLAFGTFEQNWTLDCVCHECNQYFCRELELALGRDSTEALLRFRYGLKLPTEALKLLKQRIVITVEQEGPWLGARAFLSPTVKGDEVEVLPFPQVGFRKLTQTGRFHWIQEPDLAAESVAPYKGHGIETRIVGPTDDDLQRLIQRVRDLGIDFMQQGRIDQSIGAEDNSVTVAVEATLDTIVQRAVAKIAFNYAAYTVGPDFMRRPDFDLVRRFVRLGDRTPWRVVEPAWKPILAHETAAMRITNGHLCVVEWEGVNIFRSQATLFNEMTYIVRFCRRFFGVWRHISVGHLFDPFEREIVPLTSTRFVKPPWAIRR